MVITSKPAGDIFVEQLVRRRRPGGDAVFKLGCIAAGLLLLVICFALLGILGCFALPIIIILVYLCLSYTDKEYEYSFLNGDFAVELILGKRKRSRVYNGSCDDISLMRQINSPEYEPQGANLTVIDASISRESENRWYFISRCAEGGQCVVYFNPNERLLTAFSKYLKNKMDYKS